MKRALYSVQITVERDALTGQTRVLSTNTTLPFDPEQKDAKVYEDELKVVHEVNAVGGFHKLSSSEVEDLIHKAEDVAMMTSPKPSVSELPVSELPVSELPVSELPVSELPVSELPVSELPVSELPVSELPVSELPLSKVPSVKVPGLQEDEVSVESPVSLMFMGYQNVEDEYTKNDTVRAELVLIEEGTPPTEQEVPLSVIPPGGEPPPTVTPPSARPDVAKSSGTESRAVIQKKNKPRTCCIIM